MEAMPRQTLRSFHVEQKWPPVQREYSRPQKSSTSKNLTRRQHLRTKFHAWCGRENSYYGDVVDVYIAVLKQAKLNLIDRNFPSRVASLFPGK